MSELKSILKTLIEFPSITPEDKGCQTYMIEFLKKLGFVCQSLDCFPVSNFFAVFGSEGPLLMFAGHTDVVPVGNINQWDAPPFALTEREGLVYGRGVADMKGSLAAMMLAAERFVQSNPDGYGRIGFLITSGEEGDHYECGTQYMMHQLAKQNLIPDYCIIGEPSSHQRLGDMIKIGRRGSLSAEIILHGKQGHVAYPHLAENPIHTISPVLHELTSKKWDTGNDYFPPTSLQITHIESGGIANNVIPGELTLKLNFRYSTEQTEETLQQKVEDCFKRHQLQPKIQWRLSGKPFITKRTPFVDACIKVIEEVTSVTPELSTSGGTSDGRFIAPFGVELIELGPVNATIHQVNECVSFSDLEQLSLIYEKICQSLFKPALPQ